MTKITGTLHEDVLVFRTISSRVFRMRNVSDKSFRTKPKSTFYIQFVPPPPKIVPCMINVEKCGEAR